MCGITGFWQPFSSFSGAEPLLNTMLRSLYHRGPDGYGSQIESEHGIAMGHARLAIIDLNTGDQPLASRERDFIFTTNGEFYDYKRQRAELVVQGETFATKTDSEIALHFYKLQGLDFVHDLRGEFAFALYDGEKQRLILARDRFGIKPLYFHFTPERVVYGSEVKAILPHPEVPRKLCRKSALHQLMHTMPQGTTAFEGIHAVKPGHMVIIEKDGDRLTLKEHCYWDMDFPLENERDMSVSEATHIERLREKLIESVQLRLVADVPVGCYLSGGIDSCSILGVATALRQKPITAFTIAFDHKDYDETDIAREMAEATQTEHRVLKLNSEDLYGQNYVDTVWHAERAFYNTLGVAKWKMSEFVRDNHFKVMITGEGADEMLAGYPTFKRDMYLHGLGNLPPDQVKAYQSALEETNRIFKGVILPDQPVSHPAMEALCGFTPSWTQTWMLTLAQARPLLHDEVLHELQDYDPIVALADSLNPEQIKGRHPLDIAQYSWIRTMLECQILNWAGDRMDMGNSVETRPAFLDHHFAEMAREIPPQLRIKGTTEKWILREAMREILPQVLYERQKFAFMAPPVHTQPKKRYLIEDLLNRYVSPEQVEKVGLFDQPRLKQFLENYRQESDPVALKRQDTMLNHILGLHILHHHFIETSREAIPRAA